MENRFQQNEEENGWGAYVTPPPITGLSTGESAAARGLCARVQERLPMLAERDPLLTPELVRSLEQHMVGCADCRREYRREKRLTGLLNDVPAPAPPPDFAPRIMERIERGDFPRMVSVDGLARPTIAREAAVEPTIRREVRTALGQQQTPTTAVKSSTVSPARISVTQPLATETHSLLMLVPRALAACVLTASLLFFISTSWGREALGANLPGVRAWFDQMGALFERVPLLGRLTAALAASLGQLGELLSETYRSLGASAARGLTLDAAFLIAGGYLASTRRARGQRSGA